MLANGLETDNNDRLSIVFDNCSSEDECYEDIQNDILSPNLLLRRSLTRRNARAEPITGRNWLMDRDLSSSRNSSVGSDLHSRNVNYIHHERCERQSARWLPQVGSQEDEISEKVPEMSLGDSCGDSYTQGWK